MTALACTVVMGAGPAGLAAAFELVRHGVSVDVVERADVVGGLARTIERDGYRFDLGGHRWFTKNDELNNLFVALLGDEVVHVDRISRIYYNGRFVDYPLRTSNALKTIGWRLSLRALADYAWAQWSPPPAHRERTMEEAYVAQFGRTLFERFFRHYSEKVWGDDCRRLSGDWVVQRSKGLSLFGAIRDAIRPSGADLESLIESFMYPRLGYGRLSDRFAEETVAGGGRLRLGARIAAVQHRDDRIVSLTVRDRSGYEQTLEADRFVSSIPLPTLVRLLQPAPPEAVVAAADSLVFRDLITVNLMLKRVQVTNDTWLYVHDPAIPFGRLHEPKNWSQAMVPDAGHTSLVAEYFCTIGDATWAQDDDSLCDLTVDHLARTLGFIEPNEVVGAFAVRSPRAYPIYHLGYRAQLDRVRSYLDRFGNLQLIGRGGAFRYNNADHAIESGLLAARNLLGGQYDLDRVNGAAEYLEVRRRTRPSTQPEASPSFASPLRVVPEAER